LNYGVGAGPMDDYRGRERGRRLSVPNFQAAAHEPDLRRARHHLVVPPSDVGAGGMRLTTVAPLAAESACGCRKLGERLGVALLAVFHARSRA
jgi:hypothetical protein